MSATDPLQTVYDALEAHGAGPRGPAHKFTARCPAHDDHSPSLAVREGADHRALIYCHVGCDTRAVIDALDLQWAELFPPGHRHARRSPVLAVSSTTREPADLALQALRELGITYRCTRNPCMWVAERCPSCQLEQHSVPWPLWLVREDRRVRLICGHGCPPEAILAALLDIGELVA
jgi:hypothetical protein